MKVKQQENKRHHELAGQIIPKLLIFLFFLAQEALNISSV